MVQNAIVKRVIDEAVVEVNLLRQTECGLHCDGACEGCSQKPPQDIVATASNTIGAKPGDFVEVEPSIGHNIGTSAVVFLLPCIGLGAGYLVGQTVLSLSEAAALGTAVAGLVLGFVPAYLLNRAMTRHQAPEFKILKFMKF